MSQHKISVLVGIAMGLLGLFALLQHLHSIQPESYPTGLSRDDHCVCLQPQKPSPQEPQKPTSQKPMSFDSFKIPGELDGFTPHIWQTTGPWPLTAAQRTDMASWREQLPFFSFTLMTDEQGDSFVREHYAQRPDIVDLFLRLPIPIVKADLFRYLVLVAKGGIYADIDVFCEQPISLWLPQGRMSSTDSINLIIGLEFDFDFRGEGEEVASQFANWILAAKPGNKHLQHVIDASIVGIYSIAKKNKVDVGHLELWMFPDVVNIAGPKRMTIAVLESLSEDLKQLVDDRMISDTKEPRLVFDVLIMPNNAFAAMQAGFPKDRGPVLVTHHYAGSWKQSADDAKAQKQKMGEQ